MKRLTESQLRQVIREELNLIILEGDVIQFPSRSSVSSSPTTNSQTSNVVKLDTKKTKGTIPTPQLNLIGINHEQFSNDKLLSLIAKTDDLGTATLGSGPSDPAHYESMVKAQIMKHTGIQSFTEAQTDRINFLIQFMQENGYLVSTSTKDPKRYIRNKEKKYGITPILSFDEEQKDYLDLTSWYRALDRLFPL
jgi:hypothetical protein